MNLTLRFKDAVKPLFLHVLKITWQRLVSLLVISELGVYARMITVVGSLTLSSNSDSQNQTFNSPDRRQAEGLQKQLICMTVLSSLGALCLCWLSYHNIDRTVFQETEKQSLLHICAFIIDEILAVVDGILGSLFIWWEWLQKNKHLTHFLLWSSFKSSYLWLLSKRLAVSKKCKQNEMAFKIYLLEQILPSLCIIFSHLL